MSVSVLVGSKTPKKYGERGENVFKFDITLEAENKMEVKAGAYTDSCTIYKVDEEPKEYYLEKGDSSNWM